MQSFIYVDPDDEKKPTDPLILINCHLSKSFYRVDLTVSAKSNDTLAPVLMELELFEPALFTEGKQSSVIKFCEAIQRRLM